MRETETITKTVEVTIVSCDTCKQKPLNTYYTVTDQDGFPVLDFCTTCWHEAHPSGSFRRKGLAP